MRSIDSFVGVEEVLWELFLALCPRGCEPGEGPRPSSEDLVGIGDLDLLVGSFEWVAHPGGTIGGDKTRLAVQDLILDISRQKAHPGPEPPAVGHDNKKIGRNR